MNGGTISYVMDSKPATNRGILTADRPFSVTIKK